MNPRGGFVAHLDLSTLHKVPMAVKPSTWRLGCTYLPQRRMRRPDHADFVVCGSNSILRTTSWIAVGGTSFHCFSAIRVSHYSNCEEGVLQLMTTCTVDNTLEDIMAAPKNVAHTLHCSAGRTNRVQSSRVPAFITRASKMGVEVPGSFLLLRCSPSSQSRPSFRNATLRPA
jgi:hypothetical protein